MYLHLAVGSRQIKNTGFKGQIYYSKLIMLILSIIHSKKIFVSTNISIRKKGVTVNGKLYRKI